MKHAFTMIELIYVIVILGILSAVAIPKFASTRNMADIGVARSDVAVIRSAIMSERQSRLITGVNTYISQLSPAAATTLFTGNGTTTLLTYGIVAGSSTTDTGKWTQNATAAGLENYSFRADTLSIVFTYYANSNTAGNPNGTFTCDRGGAAPTALQKACKRIVD